jgi:chemotaxis response regulator CheB
VTSLSRISQRSPGLRTLLVDPDDDSRAAVQESLASHGFDVVGSASSLAEAEPLIAAHKPELVALSAQVPTREAVKAVARIAASGATTVTYGATAKISVVRQLLNAGSVAYVRTLATGSAIGMTLATILGANYRVTTAPEKPVRRPKREAPATGAARV